MALLLRGAELLVCLLLIVWTLIFPLATVVSLAVTLPTIGLFARADARRRAVPRRATA